MHCAVMMMMMMTTMMMMNMTLMLLGPRYMIGMPSVLCSHYVNPCIGRFQGDDMTDSSSGPDWSKLMECDVVAF